jgi:hypothetical protein
VVGLVPSSRSGGQVGGAWAQCDHSVTSTHWRSARWSWTGGSVVVKSFCEQLALPVGRSLSRG